MNLLPDHLREATSLAKAEWFIEEAGKQAAYVNETTYASMLLSVADRYIAMANAERVEDMAESVKEWVHMYWEANT